MSMDSKTMARIRQQDQDAMEGLPPPAGLLLDYIDDDLIPALKAALPILRDAIGHNIGSREIVAQVEDAIRKAEEGHVENVQRM